MQTILSFIDRVAIRDSGILKDLKWYRLLNVFSLASLIIVLAVSSYVGYKNFKTLNIEIPYKCVGVHSDVWPDSALDYYHYKKEIDDILNEICVNKEHDSYMIKNIDSQYKTYIYKKRVSSEQSTIMFLITALSGLIIILGVRWALIYIKKC